jgi:chorismate mutase / prephenate dehydratase
MFANSSDLADLRRRIDAIDDRMHELLIERAELVSQVAVSKKDSDTAFYQPGREAQILRRLSARHRGALPVATVLRIWRELLAATVRIETPFAVAVYALPQGGDLWDLARDHYGCLTPISACGSAGEVIGAVSKGSAMIGILPMPQASEPDPWWRHRLRPEGEGLQVIARLPFGCRGNARPDGGEAFVVGCHASQPTGDDRTLFIIELEGGFSRARLLGELGSIGLDCTFLARWVAADGERILVEIAGFIPISDPRIANFRARLGTALYRLLPFGGYAVPLSLTVSSCEAAKG